MGKRGPAPKPTALIRLQGNPGRRPFNKKEAQPDPAMPRCPGWLKFAAKKEWRRVARRLHKAGLMTYVDRAALAAYCQAYGRWVEAELELTETGGEIIRSAEKGTLYHNPWASVAKHAQRDMVSLAREFGMTPSSRSRIVIDDSGVQKTLTLADTLMAAAAGKIAEGGRE